MSPEEYYTAPAQEIFDDVKQGAIALWQTYDDTYGYATDKVKRIKDIENVKDNTGYMVAMFDAENQQRLINEFVKLPATIRYIERLLLPY